MVYFGAKMDKFVTRKPECKYGAECYRKSDEHRKEFSHPKKTQQKIEKPEAKKRPRTPEPTNNAENGSEPKRAKETVGDNSNASDEKHKFIEEKFLFEMPPDFYNLWNLASKINSEKPGEAFEKAQIQLVGPFDVLAGKFEGKEISDEDYLLHWRFHSDPPEFQTLIMHPEFHIGYWRDDPSELPVAVCAIENKKENFPRINIVGENLFAGVKHLLDKTPDVSELVESLESEAQKFDYSLENNTSAIKSRRRKVVAPTLHGAGIVVPMKQGVGYRELPETNASLKKLLTIIGSTDEPKVREGKQDKLQEMITFVQFANDEADFGMGLELGQDLFNSGYTIFNDQINQLLSVAYLLTNRPEFGKIIEAHLAKRKNGCDLSVL